MRDGPERTIRAGSDPQPEKLPEVPGPHPRMADRPPGLETSRSATAAPDHAGRLLPVLRTASLQAEARLGTPRQPAAVPGRLVRAGCLPRVHQGHAPAGNVEDRDHDVAVAGKRV